MNSQQLKDLAEKAGFIDRGTNHTAYMDFNHEKFAELIVRECVEVCHKMAEDSDSYVVHDGDTCAEQIREHFGVEE